MYHPWTWFPELVTVFFLSFFLIYNKWNPKPLFLATMRKENQPVQFFTLKIFTFYKDLLQAGKEGWGDKKSTCFVISFGIEVRKKRREKETRTNLSSMLPGTFSRQQSTRKLTRDLTTYSNVTVQYLESNLIFNSGTILVIKDTHKTLLVA